MEAQELPSTIKPPQSRSQEMPKAAMQPLFLLLGLLLPSPGLPGDALGRAEARGWWDITPRRADAPVHTTLEVTDHWL